MTIYLDHAASTPIDPAVAARIQQLLEDEYANPSSLHAPARSARKVIEEAREIVAAALGGRPEEILFTGGGTEADNLAVLGVARRRRREGRDVVVVSAGEHHAVLDAALALRAEGIEVRLAPLDPQGRVDLDALAALVDARVALVAVMAANNETGVVQPIDEVAELARAHGAHLHSDAVQALPWRDCSSLPASTIAVSAHKLGGPKGVGALLVRRGTPLEPIVHGGGQERGLRPGTLNTSGIGGFAAAIEARPSETAPVAARRDRLEQRLLAELDDVHVSGAGAERLPGHLHLTFDRIDSESLLLTLDAQGISASGGAACSSGAAEPSHVLRAMGVPAARALGALRLSLGHSTTDEQVETAADAIVAAVRRLRGAR